MHVQFIAIVGGSGSGKTWLADHLARALGRRAARLSLDDFYADRSHLTLAQRRRINFDHPRAIDWPLFGDAVRALQAGRTVAVPHYDFTRSTRSPSIRSCAPRPLVIVDGLWLLRRRELRPLWAASIFVHCPGTERLRRRQVRDQRERARTYDMTRHDFECSVVPMHARFVEPQRPQATWVVPSPVDPATLKRLVRTLEGLIDAPPPGRTR